MPRRARQGRQRRLVVSNRALGLPQVIRGNFLWSLTSAANVGYSQLHPTIDPRLSQIADAFELYRFVDVIITPITDVTTNTNGLLALAYSCDEAAVTPTTLAQVCQVSPMVVWKNSNATPLCPRLHLDRGILQSQVKWFNYTAGAAPNAITYQGEVYSYTGGATDVLYMRVDYVIEFRNLMPTAGTYTPNLELGIRKRPQDDAVPEVGDSSYSSGFSRASTAETSYVGPEQRVVARPPVRRLKI